MYITVVVSVEHRPSLSDHLIIHCCSFLDCIHVYKLCLIFLKKFVNVVPYRIYFLHGLVQLFHSPSCIFKKHPTILIVSNKYAMYRTGFLLDFFCNRRRCIQFVHIGYDLCQVFCIFLI